MKRRTIVKSLALLPFVGRASAATSKPNTAAANAIEVGSSRNMLIKVPNIYQSIGVEPFINCKGTNTIMGGSIVRPSVQEAMEAVAPYNVQMDELAFGVGNRLAELTGAEWGMVSSGCAAGLKLVTAACLSGGDPEKLIRIPDLTGFPKDEVVIPLSSRNVYDHAIRNAGVRIITVETEDDLHRALGPRTAMIYVLAESEEPFSIESLSNIANPLGIPVVVDAAAHILTIPDVHLQKGASVVAYSGGKGLKAPSCSGLLLGRKDILTAAWQASSPHHGFGRDNKVGREEYVGMLAAVETWVNMDHEAEMQAWVSRLDNIARRVSRINEIQTAVQKPDPQLIHHVTPTLRISWDPGALHVTGQEVAEELGSVAPRVALSAIREEAGKTGISLVGYMMNPGDDELAAERIYEVLSRKRTPKTASVMEPPSADISGHWDVVIAFPNGTGKQQFFIEKQDGNWLKGIHKTEFSERDLSGTIAGNEVVFQSRYSVPGDRITSIFYGTLDGDTLSGKIDLGEYLTAEFDAKKRVYEVEQRPIPVPGGRPQAS